MRSEWETSAALGLTVEDIDLILRALRAGGEESLQRQVLQKRLIEARERVVHPPEKDSRKPRSRSR